MLFSRLQRLVRWATAPVPAAQAAAFLLLPALAATAAWLPPQTRHALTAHLPKVELPQLETRIAQFDPAPRAHALLVSAFDGDSSKAPVIFSVNGNTITGTLHGQNYAKFRLDFFATSSDNSDDKTYLGSTDVATNGSGDASFRFVSPVSLADQSVSATATNTSNGIVSPLSRTLPIASAVGACSTAVTTTADSGTGSLRAAVDCSDTTAGTQTITFAATVTPTITLTSGELLLTDSANITGPGANVLAVASIYNSYLDVTDNTASRIFEINAGKTVTISGLTIRNGGGFAPAGTTARGGGILNNGNLTLNTCAVSSNNLVGQGSQSAHAGNVQGGGIFNAGTLNLNNSTVDNNLAFGGSGTSTTTEGIANGGGIYNSSSATTIIKSSTLSSNNATAFGLTFMSNIPEPLVSGGGVWSDGPLTIQNSTIAFNGAGLGLSETIGGAVQGGGVFINSGTATLSSTIVAKNNTGSSNSGGADDVAGAATGSFNLIGDGFGLTGISNGTNNNQVGTHAAPIDPLFQPLQFNGGPTRVHPLNVGSPAIDKGTANSFSTDQRGSGYPRIFNDTSISNASDGADVGAYELQFSDLGACTTTVSNNVDFGPGTLRRAIDCANATPAADTITFAIPGNGVHTIVPGSPLPALTAPVIIDGFTQSGSTPNTNVEGAINAHLNIEIYGAFDFTSGSDGSTLRGIVGTGMYSHSNNILVKGCFFGTDATGTRAFISSTPNMTGIFITGGTGCRVGGTSAADRNLISGVGISILTEVDPISDVEIRGNLIGPDISGAAIGNYETLTGGIGISSDADSGNHPDGLIHDIRIGMPGTGGGNVISGITIVAYQLYPPTNGSANANSVHTNSIGGGSDPGIPPGSIKNVKIRNNRIGTNAAGTAALSNGTAIGSANGISAVNGTGVADDLSALQIGGTGVGESNVISGNAGDNRGASGNGIYLGLVTGATIQGNFIGTNATGTAPIPNAGSGVFLGNSTNITVGGTSAAARNIISGNGSDGVSISSGNTNTIQGNFIGTNAAGTGALPNRGNGVSATFAANNILGGSNAGEGNVISGNGSNGVFITRTRSQGNVVSGNLIGRNAANTAALGNTGYGVLLQGCSANTIGGTGASAGNIIAHNGGGVAVVSLVDPTIGSGEAIGESILGNSIFSNTKLGIDLGGDGATPNDAGDADSGANNLQNFPVITSASDNTISATLNSSVSQTYRIEFFSNPANATNAASGQSYLGFVNATTDASGNAIFTFTAPISVAGQFVTATATDASGNTSEFSGAVQAGGTIIFPKFGVSLKPAGPTTNATLTATPVFATPPTGFTFAYNFSVNGASVQNGASNTLDLSKPGFGDKGQTVSVVLSATDGTGSGTATNSVKVVDSVPQATGNTASVTDTQRIAVPVSATDADNDPLTFKLVAGPRNGTGAFVTGTDGNTSFVYTSRRGFSGTENIRFVAFDNEKRSSNIATITVNVTSFTLVALDFTGEATDAQQIAIPISATNPGGGPLTYKRVGGPTNGVGDFVTGTDGKTNFVYASRRGFGGTEVVRYVDLDASGRPSNIATITITVTDTTPMALNFTGNTTDDRQVSIPVSANNPGGGPLTFKRVGAGVQLPPAVVFYERAIDI